MLPWFFHDKSFQKRLLFKRIRVRVNFIRNIPGKFGVSGVKRRPYFKIC